MRSWRRALAGPAAFTVVACLAIGCGGDGTAPDDNDPPPAAHLWSARFGDADSQHGDAVAVDAAGNVVIAGSFVGSIDLGGGPLDSGGRSILYIARFGPAGNHLWSRSFGDAGYQAIPSVAIDASGEIVLAGTLIGTCDFGGGPLVDAGGGDVFIAKFTADGAHVWSRRFGDANMQTAGALAVDAAGNVVIAGSFWGTTDFGGGPLVSAGNADVFVASFDADGAHAWSRRFGDADYQFASGVAIDGAGNAAVTGAFYGSIDFGDGAFSSAGDLDIFLAKLGTGGELLWSRRFGDAAQQLTARVAADALGNIVLAGGFEGSVDFGGGQLASAGGSDIFAARFGTGGEHLWSARFGDASWQNALGVAVDAAGGAVITGILRGSADFGGGQLASAGDGDIFVARLGPGGDHRWSRRFGDAAYQSAGGAALDAATSVCVIGDFMGALDFGGGALTSAGVSDVCLVKLAY